MDKRAHPIISRKIGALKPDLIVHNPGNMERNLVVIEVKPINARTEEIKKDISTLTGFLTNAEYYRAIHLVYGGTEEELERYMKRSFEKELLEYLNSLDVFWHKVPQKKAEKCIWAN